jgi:penicillin-binding protein 1A
LLRWGGRIVGVFLGLAVLVVIGGGVAGYLAYQRFSADLPDLDGLRHYQPKVMSRVYAGNSKLIAELATERRIFVPFSAIPDMVKQAFVSAEDQNFWVHRGVDPVAILRAAVTDLQQMGQGRRPIGASTITQQVAKNMLVGNELSLSRKIKEAILATRIEATLSKERILELYLNEIYLGNSSYGVAAAAEGYFNKPLDQLTLADAAFLAALPKAPNNYNPFKFPDAARNRRDWVLDRMMDDHAVTAEAAQQAKRLPVQVAEFRRPETVPGANYFAEDVRRQLVDRFGADQTTQGGLTVRTSLDPGLQAQAELALRAGLMAYDRGHGGWRGPLTHLDAAPTTLKATWTNLLATVPRPPGMLAAWRLALVLETTDSEAKLGWLDTQPQITPLLLSESTWARPLRDGKPGGTPRRITDIMQVGDVVMVEPTTITPKAGPRVEHALLRQIPTVQGALVSLDPRTGRVLALAGGWSFAMSQFDRATQAQRQPGSSFKPFVYLTAMQQGITPNSLFLDAPFVLDQGAAGKWRPNNFELDFNGPVPLHEALEKSLNLVTVRVASKVGMDAVAQNAIAFHVVDSMPRVLPAALGAVDTTVLRMAGAYAGLDEGGREVVPSLIDSVQDRDGKVLWRPPGLSCSGCDSPDLPGLPDLPVLIDDRNQVGDPASAFQVVTMMQGVVQRGTGVGAVAGINHPIAGKTGTSQDFNDAWFGGFTPDLVTVVWVGFDNPSTLGNNQTGAAVAAPIWHDYMAFALKGRPVLQFIPPPDVNLVTSGGITEAFKTGQDPNATGVDSDTQPVAGSATGDTTATSASSNVDSGMGGLY